MHNKSLIRAGRRSGLLGALENGPSKRLRRAPVRGTLQGGAGRAICVSPPVPSLRASNRQSRGPPPMAGELKLEFAPFAVPAKGVLVVFCEEGLKFGAATRKAAQADRRPGRARRRGRPVQGQERLGARHRGAVRARRVAARRDRGRQAGATSSRKISSSSAASRWERCRGLQTQADDRRRSAGWR